MSTDQPQHHLSKKQRFILAGAMVFFVAQLAIPILIVPMQARALFGIGDVSITVGDIPRTIFQIVSKTLKTVGDVAFKNILRTYLNNLAYNVATQIATGEKGQQPLFVTDPKKLLQEAGDAAAGDFLDSIASDWIGKSNCQGYPGTKCKADSSCEAVNLACPEAALGAVKDCLSSIENKNKCLAAGCVVVTCTESDIESNNCPPEELPDGFAAYTSGAPECTSNFSLCDLPGPGGGGDATLKIRLNILARNTLLNNGAAVTVSGRCPLTDIIDKYDEYRTSIKETNGYDGLVGKLDPNKQYLIEYSKTFNPEATQLGAYLDILNEGQLAAEEEAAENEFAQSIAGEFKAVTTKISGAVKTPASLLSNAATSVFGKSIDPYLTYTGSAIADAVGIFTNTLANKLISRYLFGIDPKTSSGGGKSGLASFLGGASPGVTAAKFLFADLQNTNYSVAGTTDILGNLSSCPDANNPTPSTCVIDTRFRTAIEQELTLRQAVEQGLIDGNKPFGYDSNGLEPEYYNGYPYRSLLILRKYRIAPVGWELAAQYAKQFASGNYSISSMMADFDNIDSPFYKLVDPNWVLKSPEVFCRRQGAGEQIIANTPIRNEDTNNDGTIDTKDAATAVIQRQGDYCADEQLCLQENADGSCARYGYCIEDKPVWKFDGTQCNAEHASCQALTKSDGTGVSYLLNTVETNGCTADNAGCQWYCQDYNAAENTYACNGAPPGANGSGRKISFTGDVRQCDSTAAGCTEYIPRLGSGTNVLANSDFETFSRTPASFYDALKDTNVVDDFIGWSTGQTWSGELNCGLNGLAVSEAYDGFTAMRLAAQPADCSGFPASGTGTPLDGGRFLWNVMQPTNGMEFGERVEGHTYNVSFYAKTAGDDPQCDGTNGKVALSYYPMATTFGPSAQFGTVTATSTWTRYAGTFTVPEMSGGEYYRIILILHRDLTDQCDVVIDNIQFEEGALSAYKVYEQNPTINLKDAAFCSAAELGCEAYTSVTNGRTITGVISAPGNCDPNVPGSCDQCPAEYLGCSAFRELAIERPPYRPLRDPVSFVPDSGKSCPASAVGCEEYTNLETVAQGGEGKEYYSYIRMCVLSTDAQKRTYYTWEGSNEFGFQLREYSLKKSNQNDGPCTNMGAEGDPIIQAQLGASWPTCIDGGSVDRDGNGVDEEFYNPATCAAEDVGVNPDCTEYYDTGGNTYYLLRSRVIFTSDDCKNFRNSNDAPELVYHMVPGQGISCQAAYAGCRAYKGNAGDNTRDMYVKDFEDGSIGDWTGNASISTEATSAGGHSMLVSNSAAINTAGTTLGFASGNQYTISFWAKSAINGGSSNISFALNTTPSLTFTGQANANNVSWNKYTVGPVFVPVGVDPNSAQLVLFANNAFYIDNITISEVVENIYKIKGSYTECSGYEGCDQYADRNGGQHYLKSFTSLCGEDTVGCTAMLLTNNSVSPFSSTFNRERYLRGDVNYDQRLSNDDVQLLNTYVTGGGSYENRVPLSVGDVNNDAAVNATDVSQLQNHVNNATSPAEPYYFEIGGVPDDRTQFIVNDPEKSCGAAQAGCQKLGKPSIDGDGNITNFSDVYLVNNPDRYGQEMCTYGENQCDAYTAANGSAYYFKDPGQKLCEFKRVSGQDVSGWYKIGTNQGSPDCPTSIGLCSGGGSDDGKLCNSSNDCASNFCNRNPNIVPQPTDGWVGSCPATAAGCTEYRDPEQIQTGSEIVSRNYSENGGFESYVQTANPGFATDGVIDTALPDIFTPWGNAQTSAGRCTGDPERTCNTNVNCSAHGAGVCDTSTRVPCGMRLLADSQSQTGNVAARVKAYDDCSKSVTSTYNYHCGINTAQVCLTDVDCGPVDYCVGDPARYIWYGVNTDTITDNRAFKISFHARIDPNDATCDPSSTANTDFGFGLVRTIDNRPYPQSRTDYRPYNNYQITDTWTEYSNVSTFNSVDADEWYNTSGPVEELQNRFSMVFRRTKPTANSCDILIDSVSIVEVSEVFDYVPYYYIDETVDQTSCNGLVDREEGCRLFNDTSNPELPFVSTLSADGEAPAVCTDPNECDANAVIQVIRDRECKRWLECETSVQQEDAEGNVEELCLSRYVCEALDPETGQCTKVGEYESVNQTYDTPTFASKIQHYTGLVLAGLDWDRRCSNDSSITCTSDAQCGSGTCTDPQIYEGSLPVAAMEERGAISINGEIIKNGDMGDRDYAINQRLTCPLSSVTAGACPDTGNEGNTDIPIDELSNQWRSRDWDGGTTTSTWGEEDINNGGIPSPNTNLDENNVALVKTSGDIGAGTANWNGVSYNLGVKAQRNESYYASFRLRWAVPPSAYDFVRVQLAYVATNGNQVDFLTLGDFSPSDTWQEYVLGPATIGDTNSGAFVNYDSIQLQIVHNYQSADPVPSVEFYLDDLSLKPVLQTKEDNQGLLSRDCRLYASTDSPYCVYTDENNTTHKGWEGYCLEHDPRYPKYCLNWWPVDLLKGDSSAFSSLKQAVYSGRRPLYECLETDGNANQPISFTRNGAAYSTDTFTGSVVQSSNWYMCDDTSDAGEPSDHGVIRGGSPLLDHPFGYRRASATKIDRVDKGCDGDWNNDDDCDQYGDLENNPGIRDCNMPGIMFGCDSGAGEGEGCEMGSANTDADTDDEYYKWEIDSIAIIGQMWSHGGNFPGWEATQGSRHYNDGARTAIEGGATPDGPAYFIFRADEADAHKPAWCTNCWSATWSEYGGDGGNAFTLSITFDASDRLTSYSTWMNDVSDGGAFWALPIFYLKEQCVRVAQVVTEDQDKVWFERTDRNSAYLLPDLLYTYTQDFAPYGGVVQPEPVTLGPALWSYDLGRGPLYAEKRVNTDTARSGTPFSFSGSINSVGRLCSAFVSGSTYATLNECRNKADVTKCHAGPDGELGTTEDNGYCNGVGAGFCQKNSTLYCTPTTAAVDCADNAGNDYGPCIVGSCVGGANDGKLCGGTCAAGVNAGQVCGQNSDCPGSTCTLDTTYPGGTCAGGSCRVGGDERGITTAAAGVDHLKRLFARAFGAWSWCDTASGGVCTTARTYNSDDAQLNTWTADYSNMPVCAYNATAGRAVRPNYPNDYCGVPPVVDSVLCGAGGQPSATGCNNISAGQLVQLTFNINADPNQKPIKLIEVDFDNDGNADYSSVGTYDSGTVYVTHEYTAGGAYPIRARLVDNWDWCGVLKGAGSSCPSGDCRYNAETVPTPCANQGWVDTGVTANVNP